MILTKNLKEAEKQYRDLKIKNKIRRSELKDKINNTNSKEELRDLELEIRKMNDDETAMSDLINLLKQDSQSNRGLSNDNIIVRSNESFAESVGAMNTEKDLSLGKYLRGAITGKWENAENEKEEYRALSTTTGNILIPKNLSAQIIDLARNAMVLTDVPVVPMASNNLTLAKIEADPEFKFKAELAKAEMSETNFGKVELKSKMAYGLMKVSLELLESAENIDEIITEAIAKAIAATIDKAGLYGKGPEFNEPVGITEIEGINKLVGQEYITTSKYSSFIRGIGLIKNANHTPNTIAYNSGIDTDINLLTDTTGQPLNEPGAVANLNKRVSNTIKDNNAIIFDINKLLLGIQNEIRIEMSRELGFEDGSVYFRVYTQIDFATLDPKTITLIEYTAAQ